MKITRVTGVLKEIDTDKQEITLEMDTRTLAGLDEQKYKYTTGIAQDELEKMLGKRVTFVLNDGVVARFGPD